MALITLILEEPGATEGARNPLKEARAGMRLLRDIPGYRRYVIVRSILLTIELSLPYYTLLVRDLTNGTVGELGIFVVTASIAQVLSSPLWGRLADRSSRQVMGASGLLAVFAGVLALGFNYFLSNQINPLIMTLPLLIVGFARAGIRLGRKTYLIDGAPDEERPTYVALGNTIIGILTILGSGLGWFADVLGIQVLITVLMVAALIGATLAFRLPPATKMSIPG